MRGLRLLPVACAAACVVSVATATATTATATATAKPLPGLQTAIFDQEAFLAADTAPLAFKRVRAAGASYARINVLWSFVAPAGATRPIGFDAANPSDPAYSWDDVDRQVRQASAAGLQIYLSVSTAPEWAQSGKQSAGFGAVAPDPKEFGLFCRALALRYRGGFQGLPRVTAYKIWNEPNITAYLMPQVDSSGADVSPVIYRRLVNEAAQNIHAVSASNFVIAGSLSPFTVDYGAVKAIGPLRFMRELLCMSAGAHPKPTCSTKVEFDVWGHHPYTTGGPTHHAANPDDVSLGDLPKMRELLDAAVRAGHVKTQRHVGFWVTEFSWDTSPPDKAAVPLALHARWVAEALHQMWLSGVSLITWFLLRDEPYPESSFQSGLYFRGPAIAADRPKPALAAFRFPFVAYTNRAGTEIWGRSPDGSETVVVERRSGGVWKRVVALRPGASGVFERELPLHLTDRDYLRARTIRTTALPFSLRPQPDRFYRPFGN